MENVEPTETVDNSGAQSLITGDGVTETVVEPNEVQEVETVVESNEGYEAFIAALPEDMRSNPSLEKFKSTDDLVKSYIEQQKLIGRKTSIPADDATAEDWAVFYNNAGRPEDASKYNIDMPDTLKATDGAASRNMAALEAAHEAGLSEKQAETLFAKLYESESAALQAGNEADLQQYQDSADTLKNEWGENFNTNAQAVAAFEKKLGVFDSFEENGLNTNPAFLIMMSKLATDLSDNSSIDDLHTNDGSPADTDIDTQNQIVQLIREGKTAEAKDMQAKLSRSY